VKQGLETEAVRDLLAAKEDSHRSAYDS